MQLSVLFSPLFAPKFGARRFGKSSDKLQIGIPVNTAKAHIFTGRSNPGVARAVAEYLGMELSPVRCKNFSGGETSVRLGVDVDNQDTFIIQTTHRQADRTLMETLFMLDALKRANAKTRNVVLFNQLYARQDRINKEGDAISAKVVANILQTAGATRLTTTDFHSTQMQGFYDIPVDSLSAIPLMADYLAEQDLGLPVVVSPDAGGVKRAERFQTRLNEQLANKERPKATFATIDKHRDENNVAEARRVIGDVKGRTAILVDDMIDTAGTMASAAQLLLDSGAKDVILVATHPIFSGPALMHLKKDIFKQVVVTNTIPLSPRARKMEKITQLSVAGLVGDTIAKILNAR